MNMRRQNAQGRKALALVTLRPNAQDTLYHQMEIGLISSSAEYQLPLDSISLIDQRYRLKEI